MALPKEKVATGFLVLTGKVENNKQKAVYLNPDQFSRALNNRYNVADKVNRLPDVTSLRVVPLYGEQK
jgi:hypothetical protein